MAPSQRSRKVSLSHVPSLLPALKAISALLKSSKTKGMVIGGVAASLLGQPRMTADIDATVVLEDSEVEAFLREASKHGLTPRLSNPIDFFRRSAMLLLEHVETGIPVDVAQGRLPFEREAAKRASFYKVGGVAVPLPTPEDLVVMKAVAHRPQDIEDIRGIVSVNPKLDVSHIRAQVQEFAKIMEMPELWTDISPLFPPTKKPRRSTRRKRSK